MFSKLLKARVLINFVLVLTLAAGIFLRLYQSTKLEPYVDEASIGYNSYLVTNYQSDEWGSRWPVHFQAFGEWKLPVYIYSTAVIGKLTGFNTLAIRLPSTLAGLGIAVLIFLWLKKLTSSNLFSLLAVNLYLSNFWSFMLSRGGFEANLALFLVILSLFIYFSLKSAYLKLPLATIFLILAFFTYNSARLLAPIIFLTLSLNYLKTHKHKLKTLNQNLAWLIISFGLWLPAAFIIWRFWHNPTSLSRLHQVNASFSLISAIAAYLQSFSVSFWLGQGDNIIRHSQPGFGNSDLVSYFLFIFGLIILVKRKIKVFACFLILWFLALIPGFITAQPLHNLRDIFLLPLFLTALFYGLFHLFNYFKQTKHFYFSFLAFIIIFFVSITPFYSSYFQTYIKDPSLQWGTGYKELITKLTANYPNNDVYVSTDRVQPYIYWAWYLKTSPKKFVRNTPDKWYLSSVAQINKVFFLPLTDPDDCYKNICYKIKK
ncbi:MAG: hypothetical protein GXP43_03020 [bacterium]|nr:hypothetical protein [bacterium]